jgi:hypothetical protein
MDNKVHQLSSIGDGIEDEQPGKQSCWWNDPIYITFLNIYTGARKKKLNGVSR